MDPDPVDLGPETKLAAVLARWPELRDVLVALSPWYRALENPFLRSTFGRVATLRQVARAGGVPLDVLVRRLRAGAGLPESPERLEPEPARPARPDWATSAAVTGRRDARPDVAAGVHPLPIVVHELEGLPAGAVFELLTPFVPAPLLDLARRKGFESYPEVVAEGMVRTYFRRLPAAEPERPAAEPPNGEKGTS